MTNVSIDRGEVVGLLGRQGGETTTFYMVVGLLTPDRGRILLDGRDITDLPSTLMPAGHGYLPQESSVFRKLTVRRTCWSRDIDLNPRSARSASSLLRELSLGTRRSGPRCPAASSAASDRSCLITAPNYILLDEPFTGIDPIAIAEIRASGSAGEGHRGPITDHNVRETPRSPTGPTSSTAARSWCRKAHELTPTRRRGDLSR